jgi:DNA-binding response OmpR family regulator
MKKVKEFKPDLLILDVMMTQPDDGLAMAQELRMQGFKAPILMLTSISRASGMEYGKDDEMVPVDDFQEKPVEPSVLVQKVEQLLKRKGA